MRHLKNLILILGILVSLSALIQFYSVASLLLLVPWDVSFVRPEIGTWQRSLNDFFESRTGEILTFSFYTIFFTSITVYTLAKRWESALRVMVGNMLAAFGLFPVLMLSFPVAQFFFPFGEDYMQPFYQNYTRNIIPALLIILMLVLWFRELVRLQTVREKAKNKAKNEEFEKDGNILRLMDSQAGSDYEGTAAQVHQRLSES